ncbi:MAG: hypothetical protein R2695_18165 [Acidimicrobiales bacterium]
MKEAVLPFNRFPEAGAVLGPEMRSTGEVMGIDLTPRLAFVKSQLSAGTRLPETGTIFLSLADRDKALGVAAARIYRELGFELAATSGTAARLRREDRRRRRRVEAGRLRRSRRGRTDRGRPGADGRELTQRGADREPTASTSAGRRAWRTCRS